MEIQLPKALKLAKNLVRGKKKVKIQRIRGIGPNPD
jgi:hypothetical protein